MYKNLDISIQINVLNFSNQGWYSTMNTAKKGNFEALVWISATNNLTAIVKMHELPQYNIKSISWVWGIKLMSKNFWWIDFGTDLKSFMNHVQHFFMESWNKKNNASGIKIMLNLDPKMIMLRSFLIISISHTREYICAKLGVIWVVFKGVITF